MKKSVTDQLVDYLQANHGTFSAGTLQRMVWSNENGTTAIPKSVSRRLQELAEEGKINRIEINGHAHYSADPIEKKPESKLVYDPINDRMVREFV